MPWSLSYKILLRIMVAIKHFLELSINLIWGIQTIHTGTYKRFWQRRSWWQHLQYLEQTFPPHDGCIGSYLIPHICHKHHKRCLRRQIMWLKRVPNKLLDVTILCFFTWTNKCFPDIGNGDFPGPQISRHWQNLFIIHLLNFHSTPLKRALWVWRYFLSILRGGVGGPYWLI